MAWPFWRGSRLNFHHHNLPCTLTCKAGCQHNVTPEKIMKSTCAIKFYQQLCILSLIVVIGLILSAACHSIVTSLGFKISTNLVTKINFTNPLNWIKLIAMCIVEEIIFRGPLSLSKKAITASIFFWLTLLFSIISRKLFIINNETIYLRAIHIGICIIISLFVAYFTHAKYINLISIKLRENYNLLFWALCISFAIVHVDNYTGQSMGFSIYLILVIPQFVMGSLLAIVRVQKGIANSAIIHFFTDAWLFMLGVESRLSGHAVMQVLIIALLSFILLIGLFQFNLFRHMFFILMNPSARIFQERGRTY